MLMLMLMLVGVGWMSEVRGRRSQTAATGRRVTERPMRSIIRDATKLTDDATEHHH